MWVLFIICGLRHRCSNVVSNMRGCHGVDFIRLIASSRGGRQEKALKALIDRRWAPSQPVRCCKIDCYSGVDLLIGRLSVYSLCSFDYHPGINFWPLQIICCCNIDYYPGIDFAPLSLFTVVILIIIPILIFSLYTVVMSDFTAQGAVIDRRRAPAGSNFAGYRMLPKRSLSGFGNAARRAVETQLFGLWKLGLPSRGSAACQAVEAQPAKPWKRSFFPVTRPVVVPPCVDGTRLRTGGGRGGRGSEGGYAAAFLPPPPPPPARLALSLREGKKGEERRNREAVKPVPI